MYCNLVGIIAILSFSFAQRVKMKDKITLAIIVFAAITNAAGDYYFTTRCSEDIERNDCQGFSNNTDFRLAEQIVCLETVHTNGKIIKRRCLLEIENIRKAMEPNWLIEILHACAMDIRNYCQNADTLTIECLIKHYFPVSIKCQTALRSNIKKDDVNLSYWISMDDEQNFLDYVKLCCKDRMVFCSSITKEITADEILECLVEQKDNPKIEIKKNCTAVIQHYQIVSQWLLNITRELDDACFNTLCPKFDRIYERVYCISKIITQDIITNQTRISKECIKQINGLLKQPAHQSEPKVVDEPEKVDLITVILYVILAVVILVILGVVGYYIKKKL